MHSHFSIYYNNHSTVESNTHSPKIIQLSITRNNFMIERKLDKIVNNKSMDCTLDNPENKSRNIEYPIFLSHIVKKRKVSLDFFPFLID